MRIAFVSICGVPWGGSEVLWTATAKEALLQHHDVLVSVFDWPQQDIRIKELKTNGARFIYRKRFYPSLYVRIRKKLLNFFLPRGKKATYHNYLEKFKPNHILFNLAGGDELASDSNDLMVFLRQTNIPFSVFYHSLSVQNYFTQEVADNFRFILGKSANSFFTSGMQIKILEEHLNCLISNACVMSHPLSPIRSSFIRDADETVRFCIAGSLVARWKGQDTVLKILAKSKWLQRNWQLNIYGEGPDKDELLKLAHEYGINERVFFHGHTSDIEKLFQTNDLVLIPSKQDSGPIVLFEAMLAAKPVAGTYMGAMPEYIIDGETGVLAEGIQENEFEIVMEKAWNNRGQWNAWGAAGRERILALYDFYAEKTLLKKLVAGVAE